VPHGGRGATIAIRLAEEGADIIGIDLCSEIDSAGYAMSGRADLDETARLVEKIGRKAVVEQADVRDYAAVRAAIDDAVAELGRLDVVIPNAGILPMGPELPVSAFIGTIDVNLSGVLNTVHAAVPHLQPGGSIIIVGSVASFLPPGPEDAMAGPGYAGYKFAKHVLVDYVKELALQLAPSGARVNSIHPTSVDTDMVANDAMYRTYRPDLDNPTKEDIEPILATLQAMPISYVTQADVSHAVVYLASDESRYVTGVQIKIDGGAVAKHRQ